MKTISIAATFEGKGFIEKPYWPEMAEVIDIQKSSGINRAKSDAARRKSLEEYLRAHNMTLKQYEELVVLANRPFHTSGNGTQEIIIPGDKVLSFLVNCCFQIRSAGRPCPPEQLRSLATATDWSTNKYKADGEWTRPIVPKSGTGAILSNQRAMRTDYYIKDFTAKGSIMVDEQFVKPEIMCGLIKWGGMSIGIGSARKMGYGRFTVVTTFYSSPPL